MKKWCVMAMVAVMAAAGAAQAANNNPTVSKKTVSYRCDQGHALNVTYGFNKQGLPTYASAFLNGKRRVLPINLDHSGAAGTMFGKEDSYMMNADYMDTKNYHKSALMVTEPDNSILYKNCEPRRSRR
ncbi:ACP-like domain-containing protein [Neisseria yangbaofengii]|uniref:ACP-like domain-containing protein n=1 Tax=Neisseria yangbaofengii TaxID=2709396 RepID=UPI001D026E57|nr:adhesin [Neisseria yangbaofengii]